MIDDRDIIAQDWCFQDLVGERKVLWERQDFEAACIGMTVRI